MVINSLQLLINSTIKQLGLENVKYVMKFRSYRYSEFPNFLLQYFFLIIFNLQDSAAIT